jgi:putative transcriptional regulator
MGPFSNPTPEQVREARSAAGMTQSEAARAVRGTMRAWQEWEAGNRRMHPGLWELFRLKTQACV